MTCSKKKSTSNLRGILFIIVLMICTCAEVKEHCGDYKSIASGERCGGDVHTHSWGDWTTVTQASCTAPGLRTGSCSCGETQSETIPKLTGTACEPSHTHSYGSWQEVVAPTCTAPGQEIRSCNCGANEYQAIPQLSGSSCVTGNTFIDSRDTKSYRTVTIGMQTWMAENLNYNASGSVCYDNQDSYCNTYGRLYDWAMVMGLPSSCNSSTCASQVQGKHQGICPAGWHMPSDAEWTTLTDFVGGSSTAGTKLKSTSGWSSGGNGNDYYGFSALPGGSRWSDGSFDAVGYDGRWWSASEYGAYDAWYRNMSYYYDRVYRYNLNKTFQFSVRCLLN